MEKIKRSVFQEGMPIAFFNGGILMDITNYSEEKIVERENALHAWFTKGCDPMLSQIDGLDIGWGGVQRWATSVIPPTDGVHLDFACGYATFLAQLGWRFPRARLVGLNIDFMSPHAGKRPRLLFQSGRGGITRGCRRPQDAFYE